MKRDVIGALRALAVPTLALFAVLAIDPGRIELAVRIYALVLCGAGLVIALAALRRSNPPAAPLRSRTGPREALPRPPGLARIEHEAALGVASAFDLHYRLAPRLRAIATGLLRSRRRVALGSDPMAAQEILGEETWALVRPDRPAPEDRRARGIPVSSLREVVDALESI